jgi:hypothetical protein
MNDEVVVLDDGFVLQQLTRPANMRELAPSSRREDEERARHASLQEHVKKCLELFDQHRGFHYAASPKPNPESRLLRRGLDIVGLTLGFESALDLLERVIESDWLAHVDLRKEKRYRDHITHPVRVTAIGWWLLHRADEFLIRQMADHYRQATAPYLRAHRIDLGDTGWTTLVACAWLAAGLLHDSAYPFEYHLRAGAQLQEADALRLIAAHPESFKRRGAARVVLDRLGGSWLQQQKLGISERLAALPGKKFKHSHALLGALVHTASTPDPLASLRGLVRQLAARAILTHHDSDDQAIASDPLAHLLFVADNLQFWGRPFVHTSPDPSGGHALRTLVECRRVELEPRGEGYLARLVMTAEKDDMAILKDPPYAWKFEEFCKPNRRLEALLAKREGLPTIELTHEECIRPQEFRDYMGS